MTTTLQLVTIVAESVLERELIELVRTAGASGYTLTDARGEGSRGVRASEWEGQNLRLETLVSKQVASDLLESLAQRYFPQYAVVAWSQEVSVVRAEKYLGPGQCD
jgi:hypothetical protein